MLAPSELVPGVVDVAVFVGAAGGQFGTALAASAVGADIGRADQRRMLAATVEAAQSINSSLGAV